MYVLFLGMHVSMNHMKSIFLLNSITNHLLCAYILYSEWKPVNTSECQAGTDDKGSKRSKQQQLECKCIPLGLVCPGARNVGDQGTLGPPAGQIHGCAPCYVDIFSQQTPILIIWKARTESGHPCCSCLLSAMYL